MFEKYDIDDDDISDSVTYNNNENKPSIADKSEFHSLNINNDNN